MDTDKTISQMLTDAGYSHAATPNGGAHRITEAATGRLVGYMHHNQAADFLAALPVQQTAA